MDDSKKIINVGDLKIECIERYGYNNHYYVTLYDDTEGNCEYMGQLVDAQIGDSNIERRVKKFVEENV